MQLTSCHRNTWPAKDPAAETQQGAGICHQGREVTQDGTTFLSSITGQESSQQPSLLGQGQQDRSSWSSPGCQGRQDPLGQSLWQQLCRLCSPEPAPVSR